MQRRFKSRKGFYLSHRIGDTLSGVPITAEEHTTKQKATSASTLLLNAAFVNALYNGLKEAILAVQFGTRTLVHWNKGAEAMFGYTAQEVLGETIEIIYPDPHSFEEFSQLATPSIRQTGAWQAEWKYRRRDGSCFPAEVVATMIEGSEGSQFYVIVVRDISTRKQAAASFKEQLLENERMATIGVTSAKLAHEISNPLQVMVTTVDLLQQFLSGKTDIPLDLAKSIVQDLRGQVNLLLNFLDEFKDITRPSKLQPRPLNWISLVRELLALEAPYYAKLGIRVEENLATDLPLIEGDPVKLKQALLNLLKNAVDAMPRGGTLKLHAYRDKNVLVLEVTDTGVGIPEGMNVFDLFITSKPMGTGLGLPIVQDIVNAHHGSISYTSERDKGTTFKLELPLLNNPY